MQDDEIRKLDAYFKRMFGSRVSIKPRVNKFDSAEVFINSEFIGIIYRDNEDGDLSYHFSMAILNGDL
ncbi:DUF3126 family protein [Candidatus Liberibacter sp.]|uniref:DUF3126 family protein n=1 Tax=Candidatus Liberibacter sp. TaxID=34022 RepID=UPI0015F38FDD|nr:DUF3126 family protein [Candidatus Liberibacter sp.]MBA5724123.1 DUF3126 family protein [Candidatus Liberibacter sp.]